MEFHNSYVSLEALEQSCQGNEVLEGLLKEVYDYCDRYAETLCRFEQIVNESRDADSGEARAEIERVRGKTHDATIDAINLLARSLKKSGRDSSWIAKVAASERAGYGNFALTTALERALETERKKEDKP